MTGLQQIKTYKNREDAILNGALRGMAYFDMSLDKITILENGTITTTNTGKSTT